MDLHKAIYKTHSNVKTINGDTQNDIVAKDKNGNDVTINWTTVNAWTDPEQYKIDRANEYPSMADQLDDIFHNGIDGWKATIQAIKDKYPKE
jgi:hypothetical protein